MTKYQIFLELPGLIGSGVDLEIEAVVENCTAREAIATGLHELGIETEGMSFYMDGRADEEDTPCQHS